MTRCIGIVSPGAMGAAVGRSLAERGWRVAVALEGRSGPSRDRARAAGLEDLGGVEALVRESEVLLSIVPPKAALEVATSIGRALGHQGGELTFIDANAISPMRAEEVAQTLRSAGARYVDGGIIGGPPRAGARTDLFLSGTGSETLVSELTTPELAVTSLGPEETAASALKMCFAAWSKVSAALLISIRALARIEGVDDALVALWRHGQPDALERSERVDNAATRAWRWADEMAEIAKTFESAGLPGGAASAASALYERLAGFKDRQDPVSLDEVLKELGG